MCVCVWGGLCGRAGRQGAVTHNLTDTTRHASVTHHTDITNHNSTNNNTTPQPSPSTPIKFCPRQSPKPPPPSQPNLFNLLRTITIYIGHPILIDRTRRRRLSSDPIGMIHPTCMYCFDSFIMAVACVVLCAGVGIVDSYGGTISMTHNLRIRYPIPTTPHFTHPIPDRMILHELSHVV